MTSRPRGDPNIRWQTTGSRKGYPCTTTRVKFRQPSECLLVMEASGPSHYWSGSRKLFEDFSQS
jgi:hypothetical protein